jgi:uncharacterized Zn finger protein (UPF0148 family)
MDAKSKADFINSVASGSNITCPECGANNKSGSRFCIVCGAKIAINQESQNNAPAFEPTKEAASAKAVEYVEPNNAFAQGLPDWSIEPPQVMVRRR